jgi:hypothetical protein
MGRCIRSARRRMRHTRWPWASAGGNRRVVVMQHNLASVAPRDLSQEVHSGA